MTQLRPVMFEYFRESYTQFRLQTNMMQYTWKFINQSTSFLSSLERKMSTSSSIVSVLILNHQNMTIKQRDVDRKK